jgi:hypothetical protein
MDLERVAAVIRPRSPWEAIDLGFGMVRAWWRPIGAAWLATVAPVWCLIFLLLSGKPGWALFLLWWLRPFFDRVPLFVVSRRLFGEPMPAGAVAAELPRLWGRDLGAGLIAQRLDPARSFHLPIGLLEDLTGGQRKRRAELLGRGGQSPAVWLTFGCSLLELAVAFGLLEVLGLMAPQPESGVAAALRAAAEGDAPYWLNLLAGGIAFLAFTIVEPFYVAAGFSLYLSRRTRLEGWDVEIAFRRLAGRLTGAARRGKAVAGLLLALGLFAAHPAPVRAAAQQDPEEAIKRILAHPDFRTTETITTLKRKATPRRPAPERSDEEPGINPGGGPSSRSTFPEVAFGLTGAAGCFVIVGIVIILAALAVAVGRSWRRRPRSAEDEEDGKPPLPDAVFGLDIRPESLPDDVPAAAWTAWERGDPEAALALLYRGALASLVHRDGLDIAPSWTEGDCLAVVRRRGAAESAAYFAQLTQAWQSTAYAHRPPDRAAAQALCAAWNRFFQTYREAA